MQQRAVSAIGVVLVGLVPAILGGPVWAAAFAILCVIGYSEFVRMARGQAPKLIPVGLVLVPCFAVATYVDWPERALIAILAIAVAAPLVIAIHRDDLAGSFIEWAISVAGVLYLGVPLFAAIRLREMPGVVDASWITSLAERTAWGWDAHPRGLAWLVLVILVTWLSDTFAYLGGRHFGRRPLIPVVSPKKTWEGLTAGVLAATVTGAVCLRLFGLDERWWIGAIIGAVLSVLALYGDLAESVLKRQAGVKDSGSLIPGHGGMLDRLDALLFTFVAGWYLALLADSLL